MREWVRPLELLEAAYQPGGTNQDWLTELVRAFAAVLPREDLVRSGACVQGRVDGEGRTVLERLDDVCAEGVAVRDPQGFWPEALLRRLPPELQQTMFFSAPLASTASQASGLGERLVESELWVSQGWAGGPLKDSIGICFHDGGVRAGVVSIGLRETSRLTARERLLGERLAVHLGAAFRLRGAAAPPEPERADAVFTTAGKLESLRPRIDAGTVAEGFARRQHARQRSVQPEAALEIWRGLHEGRWSLVDYIDTDGKSFVLAVSNEPAPDVVSALTKRQRATVALAALGYGNKQIAYALGLSVTAVAMLLARARAATRTRSRAELVRAFKRSMAGRPAA